MDAGGAGISVVPEYRVVVCVITAGVPVADSSVDELAVVGTPGTGVAAVTVITWTDEPGRPGRVMVKTDGDAGEGGDVKVEEEEDTDRELAADPGGGSAEATGAEADVVNSDAEATGAEVDVVTSDADPLTVPTVRVKLAVTMW